MTRWFEIMIDSAMLETMTIEVAADSPPMKANSASVFCPAESGTVSTNRSGLASGGRTLRPEIVIGTTNRLINIR